jgi:hypothetical protein
VPLLDNQYQLNHYADQLIQSQSVLLNGVDPAQSRIEQGHFSID